MPEYVRIYESLRNDILLKHYREGEFLPSESALQKQFSASRTTVRHALQLLKTDGLICIRRGSGSVVQNVITEESRPAGSESPSDSAEKPVLSLSGRSCVFAGGTGNIGWGAVKAMVKCGMNVALVTHNPERARKLADECSGLPGRVLTLVNAGGDSAALSLAREAFGSVDVVISSTGGLDPKKPLEKITPEELEEKLVHQVSQPFDFIRTAVPYLKESRAPRIILVTTGGAVNGYAGESLLDSIGRGAVISMTYALSRELAPYGITVNGIARSAVLNDSNVRSGGYDSSSALPDTLLKRIGTTEEFGALVIYIASEESAHTTGHIFNLTGGIWVG